MEGIGTTGPATTGGVKERLTTCAVGITAGAGTKATEAGAGTKAIGTLATDGVWRVTTTGGLNELLTTPVSGTIGAPRYAMLPVNIIGSGS